MKKTLGMTAGEALAREIMTMHPEYGLALIMGLEKASNAGGIQRRVVQAFTPPSPSGNLRDQFLSLARGADGSAPSQAAPIPVRLPTAAPSGPAVDRTAIPAITSPRYEQALAPGVPNYLGTRGRPDPGTGTPSLTQLQEMVTPRPVAQATPAAPDYAIQFPENPVQTRKRNLLQRMFGRDPAATAPLNMPNTLLSDMTPSQPALSPSLIQEITGRAPIQPPVAAAGATAAAPKRAPKAGRRIQGQRRGQQAQTPQQAPAPQTPPQQTQGWQRPAWASNTNLARAAGGATVLGGGALAAGAMGGNQGQNPALPGPIAPDGMYYQ